MNIVEFDQDALRAGNTFKVNDTKYGSGQVAIIGGSRLFHGAPILSLKCASRLTGMTFFSSFEQDREVAEKLKANLSSFVWVDRDDVDSYVEKSDAVLIGPGLMRSHTKENNFVCDAEGDRTRTITLGLFKKFPNKRWIVDGGSLQVVSPDEMPKGAAITPNEKEFEMLFGEKQEKELENRAVQLKKITEKFGLTVLTKGEVNMVVGEGDAFVIRGGNEGLVKGGVGDVIAGTAIGLAAKNDLSWSLSAASYLVKKAAERLAAKAGFMFNADDLADEVPLVWGELVGFGG